jgi:acyl-CoA synthetase (AMP-forming)/AMP-acid ligase II
MNIAQILSTHADTRPEATAIIDTYHGRQRATSFAVLELASARSAALLWQAGLRPGDVVLVFQPMSAELYIALAAIFRLGLIAMFLDPGQGRAHIEQCCALYPPLALIASSKAHLLRFVSPALRRIPHKFMIAKDGNLEDWRINQLATTIFKSNIQNHLNCLRQARPKIDPSHPDIFPCTLDTPALLTFTSGSTGHPKAALRTHGFLLAQHRALVDSLKLTAGQIDLATMPIVALANLASGVTSLIPKADLRYPGAIKPTPVVTQIQTYRVQSVVASPALLERLAHDCLGRQITLTSLQKIFTGGAPVFPRLLDQLQQVAPNAEVTAVYGSTEAEPMAKVSRNQISAVDRQMMRSGRGLLVGQPVETIRLRVMRDQWGRPVRPYTEAEFDEVQCSPHEAGEIVVSGEHVLSGYLHGYGDAETKFKVENTVWHRTGDAGYLDAHGRLWLLGRCAARIEDEHGVLYPFAVECAISDLPDIHRSAVVSLNQRRILVVEFYPHANRDIIPLKETLAWAYLDEIRLCKHIPVDKRHNAKIDYPALYKLLK